MSSPLDFEKTLIHGGNLQAASAEFGRAKERWIDLSTGINPLAYPCTDLPAHCMQQLPYIDESFGNALTSYYGEHPFLALAGSQALIQTLPRKLAKLPVLLPSLGYQEHHAAWLDHGNIISQYNALDITLAHQDIEASLAHQPNQHLLIINPNNPSGQRFTPSEIKQYAKKLGSEAVVIIDEAFIDLYPEDSLLNDTLDDNILVLRSFGKFFGLAGIRAGFAFANSALLSKLSPNTQLWPLNGPALHLVAMACRDTQWQLSARQAIVEAAQQSKDIFAPLFLSKNFSMETLCDCGLFQTYKLPLEQGKWLYEFFAQAGILLRLIPVNNDQALLRTGIIELGNSAHIKRLNQTVLQAQAKFPVISS